MSICLLRFRSFLLSLLHRPIIFFFFFFNDTATTEIYTLSLHDALPISIVIRPLAASLPDSWMACAAFTMRLRNTWLSSPTLHITSGSAPNCVSTVALRSEEHTSELQSRSDLVCRLLLEKKKK